MDYKFFLCVFGLVLVIEGFPYAAFPKKIKSWLIQVMEAPESTLRILGIVAMATGVFLVFLGRR